MTAANITQAKQTGWACIWPHLCFVLCAGSGDQWKQEINKLSHDGLSGKTDMRFTVCARAVHICDHDMCYRGLHLNLSCASTRVDLNVIPILERHFICFLLVFLRSSALAVIFSCALGLRNPSAFSCAVVFSHAYMTPSTYIINAFLTQVQWDFSLALESCRKPWTYW